MPYHVIVHSGGLFGPTSDVWDVDEERLRERVIEPYERGEPITFGGKTFTAEDPPRVEIYEGPSRAEIAAAEEPVLSVGMTALGSSVLREVTDDFIKVPFGGEATVNQPAKASATGNSIFVVHGRNLDAAERVARRVEKAVGEAHPVVLLGEQSDNGLTIIEKLEKAAETAIFAIVVMTADDVGRLAEGSDAELRPRARQNVVLELGYFTALLGRAHVAPVVESEVELPSDYLGIIYIDRRESDWDIRLARRLREAGLDADLNRLA